MMEQLKVMTIFGTRPEAIKMAPLVKKLKNNEKIKCIVTVTAQHREMLDQVLDLFAIEPDYDLDIMSDQQSLVDITVNVLKKLESVLKKESPQLVLVHGDTTTTFIGALSSFYKQIDIGHVEAGLRTNNKYSPYPEEMNRHLTGVLTDLNFAPTLNNKENLLKENVDEKKIFVTGNTVIDAIQEIVKSDYSFKNEILKDIDFENNKVILLTAHRRENLGNGLTGIFQAVNDIIKSSPEAEVVFPVHLNPKVRKKAYKYLKNNKKVHLIEPLGYLEFANLMNKAYLIMTDSGGIQEEAPGLGKPVLVLRDTTERQEAIQAGTVKKVGVNREIIFKEADLLLKNNDQYLKMAEATNPYGDGKAVERIIDNILFHYNIKGVRPEPFQVD
ncbi:MAG TPA: UDP-N-acetylglucosamine 2-epimerase (non-hydrolyzing) [Halanaerobiales bacterium]|nr:UDP-N-acetylglucosamine 2-epimerase (non-hydrolyzing) [Halanaerobiales bacterium]